MEEGDETQCLDSQRGGGEGDRTTPRSREARGRPRRGVTAQGPGHSPRAPEACRTMSLAVSGSGYTGGEAASQVAERGGSADAAWAGDLRRPLREGGSLHRQRGVRDSLSDEGPAEAPEVQRAAHREPGAGAPGSDIKDQRGVVRPGRCEDVEVGMACSHGYSLMGIRSLLCSGCHWVTLCPDR